MSWQPELDDLEKRKVLARKMGGAEKIQRQHDNGKLTVRERVDRFLDPDTFQEIGSLTGSGQYDEHGNLVDFTPANQIMGKGTVDGRPVIVYGDDFTGRGRGRNHQGKSLLPEAHGQRHARAPDPADRRHRRRRFSQETRQNRLCQPARIEPMGRGIRQSFYCSRGQLSAGIRRGYRCGAGTLRNRSQ